MSQPQFQGWSADAVELPLYFYCQSCLRSQGNQRISLLFRQLAGFFQANLQELNVFLAPKLPILLVGEWQNSMEKQAIQDRIELIRGKREALVKLLEQPDIGMLRIDVNQALEEMDDLLAEFDEIFPASGANG